jgi:hypothetical protein
MKMAQESQVLKSANLAVGFDDLKNAVRRAAGEKWRGERGHRRG